MPWCDDCSKFWNPPELRPGSKCPRCGRSLQGAVGTLAGTGAERPNSQDEASSQDDPVSSSVGANASSPLGARTRRAPWHFKLLIVGVTVYMVYRIYWLAEWLPKHL
ncbi:MAG TPA: hypothetical protein VFN61_01335 [Acidimicrobiales bacterium]|nr:hypothetical protein [Acidimicrobiales bacterium]